MPEEFNYVKFLAYLEKELAPYKKEIKKENPHCKDNPDENIFLYCTYDIIQQGGYDNPKSYIIHVYRELPKFYWELILNKVNDFIKENDYKNVVADDWPAPPNGCPPK